MPERHINIRKNKGDIIGTDVSGLGNIIGKNITINGDINQTFQLPKEIIDKILSNNSETQNKADKSLKMSIINETEAEQILLNCIKKNMEHMKDEYIGNGLYRYPLDELFYDMDWTGYEKKEEDAIKYAEEAYLIDPINIEVLHQYASQNYNLYIKEDSDEKRNEIADKIKEILFKITQLLQFCKNDYEWKILGSAILMEAIIENPRDKKGIERAKKIFEKIEDIESVENCNYFLKGKLKIEEKIIKHVDEKFRFTLGWPENSDWVTKNQLSDEVLNKMGISKESNPYFFVIKYIPNDNNMLPMVGISIYENSFGNIDNFYKYQLNILSKNDKMEITYSNIETQNSAKIKFHDDFYHTNSTQLLIIEYNYAYLITATHPIELEKKNGLINEEVEVIFNSFQLI